jgi:hypothetical protein
MRKIINFIINYLLFQFSTYKSIHSIKKIGLQACLNDNTPDTGFDRHYTYFPAWAYRTLLKYNPKKHVDISSSLTFCSMVSATIPTEFYDYRPAKLVLSGLSSERADLLCLPFKDNSIKSLSCMHVIEHIGLGRYGDSLDPDGDMKAARELVRVLKTNGNLLVVVPVGKPIIMFNAHRIYSYDQVIKMFSGCTLKETYLIPDSINVNPITNPELRIYKKQSYACGCFWFTKN